MTMPDLKISPRNTRVRLWLAASLLWTSTAFPQTNLSPVPFNSGRPAPNLPLQEIKPGLFELGQVRLDKTRRSVSFPAAINMREGLLEYLVVTDYGKIHESLLRTDVQPYHIHLAFLLLGAKGAGTNAFPQQDPAAIPGEKVTVELSWTSADRQVTLPAEEALLDLQTQSPASRGPWVYNGSRVVEGTFLAQASGSIISLILDEASLLNNPRADADNDEVWTANSHKDLPPLNWPVTVTIHLPRTSPAPNSAPDAAPGQAPPPATPPPDPDR